MQNKRYKNLRIYYGVNNLKKGPQYNSIGKQVFMADPAKEWYITYQFFNIRTNAWVPVFVRGINRIKELAPKMAYAKARMQAVKEDLDAGFNPLTNRFESTTSSTTFNEVGNLPFKPAMEWALSKKNRLGKSTLSSYKTNITYMTQAMERIGYANIPVQVLTKGHLNEAFEALKKVRPGLNAPGLNDYITNICGLFSILYKKDAIHNNIAAGIETIPEPETSGFVPPDDIQFARIKDALKTAPFGFRLYCMLIYQTGIRPKELNKLQVGEIDFENLLIKLKAESDTVKEKTKNKKSREVPITQATAQLLKEQIKSNPDPQAYPFGIKFECTMEYCHRNRYSEAWSRLIKIPLGIDNDMYSLKHRGADDRANDSALESDAIAHLFGHHSNILVRKIYNKKKTKLNEVLRDGTPEF